MRIMGAKREKNVWSLSASKDHYRCMHFYVPETHGYQISGSYTKLYPQHCSLPRFNDEEHATELSKELIASLKKLRKTSANKKKIIETLKAAIDTQ